MRYWRILTLLLVVAVAGINLWRTGLDSLRWIHPPVSNPPLAFATVVPAVFALGFAWLIGALLAGLLWPRRGETALVLSVGAGVGLGVTSVIFHFASQLSAQPLVLAAPVELLLSCVLLFLWLRKMRQIPPPAVVQPARSWLGTVVRAAAWLGGGVGLFTLVVTWRAMPAELCSQALPGQLPLLPASMARAWAYIGATAPIAAGLSAAAFSAATAGVLVAGVARLRNRLLALTGALVLLSTPFFSRFTAIEHADIPFGFFVLAATVLLSLARDEGDGGLLFLAGLTAGLAAWTKPAGLLFCGALAVVFCVTSLRANTWRRLPLLLGGLALALIPLLLAGFVSDGENRGDFVRLGDWSRHQLILAATWRDLPRFGEWYALPFFVMALHLIGPGRGWLERRTLAAGGLLVLLGAACYSAGLLGPADLQEYLDVSLARLLMQLWPTVIFLWCLLAVRVPAAPGAQTSTPGSPAGSPPSGQSA